MTVIEHLDPFEEAIVAVAIANIERERREQDDMREAAWQASLSVFRRGQREKALARGVRFFSLAFVLMMGVAAVAEHTLAGAL